MLPMQRGTEANADVTSQSHDVTCQSHGVMSHDLPAQWSHWVWPPLLLCPPTGECVSASWCAGPPAPPHSSLPRPPTATGHSHTGPCLPQPASATGHSEQQSRFGATHVAIVEHDAGRLDPRGLCQLQGCVYCLKETLPVIE